MAHGRAGRAPPSPAAVAAATALLTPQALAAVRAGAPLSVAAFLLTLAVAIATVIAVGRFLNGDLTAAPLKPARVLEQLTTLGAVEDERRFDAAMVALVGEACDAAEAELRTLHRQFTEIMFGILFVLCGLALAAAVAW